MIRQIRLVVLTLVLAFPGGCGNLVPQHASENAKAKLEATIGWLNKQPQENILKYKKVNNFLAKQNVYVSMTTSPKRIRYLDYVIRTLDLRNIEAIILALPERFGRDQSTYDIPEDLLQHPKVVIIRIPKDLGPITKMIPAIEYVREHRDAELAKNDVVISADDDTGYPIDFVNQMIKAIALNDYDVVASSAPSIRNPDWHIENTTAWPMPANELVVEGFGGIGYRVGAVNTATMREMLTREAQLGRGKNCYLSDDLLISYALAHHGIHRYVINNKYFNSKMIKQYDYGMEEDALHNGAGDKPITDVGVSNANHFKYARCFNFLVEQFPSRAFPSQNL